MLIKLIVKTLRVIRKINPFQNGRFKFVPVVKTFVQNRKINKKLQL